MLKNIEKTLGRIKIVQDGPRPIDLDILLYDNLVIQGFELVIPHPRMFERNFVLKPLKEIMDESKWAKQVLPMLKDPSKNKKSLMPLSKPKNIY